MTLRYESCTQCVRGRAYGVIFTVLLVVPLVAASDTITLNKEGPETAYEGDLIEYSLEVVNTGVVIIDGVEVLDTLPAEVDFVDAMPTPGGVYNPVSGVWTLPALGTGEDDNAAGLKIQALVEANLIADPTKFVTVTNRAEVTAPVLPERINVEVNTNIVCAFCIDWEIVSVELGSDHKVDPPDPFKSRFFLHVQVANNGPVISEATLSVTHFNISGGGFGSVALAPALPVPILLDVGEIQTITFSTDWEDGPDSDYTISWGFKVSDVALMDPVVPNTSTGSWSGKVEGGGGGGSGGGCSIYGKADIDPLWLCFLILPGIFLVRRKI